MGIEEKRSSSAWSKFHPKSLKRYKINDPQQKEKEDGRGKEFEYVWRRNKGTVSVAIRKPYFLGTYVFQLRRSLFGWFSPM